MASVDAGRKPTGTVVDVLGRLSSMVPSEHAWALVQVRDPRSKLMLVADGLQRLRILGFFDSEERARRWYASTAMSAKRLPARLVRTGVPVLLGGPDGETDEAGLDVGLGDEGRRRNVKAATVLYLDQRRREEAAARRQRFLSEGRRRLADHGDVAARRAVLASEVGKAIETHGMAVGDAWMAEILGLHEDGSTGPGAAGARATATPAAPLSKPTTEAPEPAPEPAAEADAKGSGGSSGEEAEIAALARALQEVPTRQAVPEWLSELREVPSWQLPRGQEWAGLTVLPDAVLERDRARALDAWLKERDEVVARNQDLLLGESDATASAVAEEAVKWRTRNPPPRGWRVAEGPGHAAAATWAPCGVDEPHEGDLPQEAEPTLVDRMALAQWQDESREWEEEVRWAAAGKDEPPSWPVLAGEEWLQAHPLPPLTGVEEPVVILLPPHPTTEGAVAWLKGACGGAAELQNHGAHCVPLGRWGVVSDRTRSVKRYHPHRETAELLAGEDAAAAAATPALIAAAEMPPPVLEGFEPVPAAEMRDIMREMSAGVGAAGVGPAGVVESKEG